MDTGHIEQRSVGDMLAGTKIRWFLLNLQTKSWLGFLRPPVQ